MKTKLLYSALIASCLVALSSCDPNDWNDKLDGFDGDKGITNKQMIAYTFTDADYTNLAANSANIKQAGDTLSKELKVVSCVANQTYEVFMNLSNQKSVTSLIHIKKKRRNFRLQQIRKIETRLREEL